MIPDWWRSLVTQSKLHMAMLYIYIINRDTEAENYNLLLPSDPQLHLVGGQEAVSSPRPVICLSH